MKDSNRSNTYLNKEFFKIVLIAPTKEKSEEVSQWLTGSNKSNRGVYNCPFKKTQLIVFYRWPSPVERQATTVAVEGMVVYAEDAKEFEELKPEIKKYGKVPNVVVVSPQDLTREAREIKGFYFPFGNDSSELKIKLDEMDKRELSKIQNAFNRYDKDNSGSIDTDEMKQIAISLGQDPNTEEFKQSMLALDVNGDNIISFNEFISWWKIGRQNTMTLPKIYQLNEKSKKLVDSLMNYSEYVKAVSELPAKSEKSQQKVSFKGSGLPRPRTFIEYSLAVGGPMRDQMAVDFLKQFTKNPISKNNWVSMLFTLLPGEIESERAKLLLEDFKDNLLKWGEDKGNLVFISFVKNLLLFETSSTENAVVLACRLKTDIEELVKGSLKDYFFLIKNFADEGESFWINLKAQSNLDLYDNVKRDEPVTLGEFLRICEVKMDGEGHRDRLKTLYQNLKPEYKDYLSALKYLFLPYNLESEIEGDINESVDESLLSTLNEPLNNVNLVVDLLKKCIPEQLLKSTKNFEIGFNAFNTFSRIKFRTKAFFEGK